MTNLSIIVVLLEFSIKIDCIWPPSYRIKLQDNENFIISDIFPNYDDAEMIPISESNNERFFNIHQFADRYNKKTNNNKQFNKIINETNFDLDDPEPWQAGYVDGNGNFLDEDEKIEIKRDEQILKVENITEKQQKQDYDYNNLNKQYYDEIKKEFKENSTEFKDEETPGNVIEEIFKPKNCTVEKLKGIGINALRCLTHDLTEKQKEERLKLIKRLFIILTIWFSFYLIIAIPCWCIRGWCCCCCGWCFKCCRPHQLLDEARYFFMNNPIGVYQLNENDQIEYPPTIYEESIQKRLEKAIMKIV